MFLKTHGKKKEKKRGENGRQTGHVRASEVGLLSHQRFFQARRAHHVSVFPSLSLPLTKTTVITMIRSLLAVVGMATMAGKFAFVAGCGLIWVAARFEMEMASDSAGDGNNPLVV